MKFNINSVSRRCEVSVLFNMITNRLQTKYIYINILYISKKNSNQFFTNSIFLIEREKGVVGSNRGKIFGKSVKSWQIVLQSWCVELALSRVILASHPFVAHASTN